MHNPQAFTQRAPSQTSAEPQTLLLRRGCWFGVSIGRGYPRRLLPPRGESGARHNGPRHTHAHEDEAYFVIAGELEVIVGDEVFVLRAGGTLMGPPRHSASAA
jgi:mannose-6-phosphate isomerase-like protein (cupin superfamily)